MGEGLTYEDAVESCAQFVEWCATRYPEDVFPANSMSRDAAAGTALRLMLPRIAAEMRSAYLTTTEVHEVPMDVEAVVAPADPSSEQDSGTDPAVL
jgi:hypothetical protein